MNGQVRLPAWKAENEERMMRWLRANGVTEDANQIVDNVYADQLGIHYEVVHHVVTAAGGGWARTSKLVPHRVTFSEANRH